LQMVDALARWARGDPLAIEDQDTGSRSLNMPDSRF
jgi:hypothetical protein